MDKLVGLGVGADDYVTKPFSPREVTARVKAVLRGDRGVRAAEDATLRFAGLTIDTTGREVVVNGAPVMLSSLSSTFFAALAAVPGRVFSRAQLLERVWGYDFYGDERVVMCTSGTCPDHPGADQPARQRVARHPRWRRRDDHRPCHCRRR